MAKQQRRGQRVTIRQRKTGWSCLWRGPERKANGQPEQHSELRATLAEAEDLQRSIERGDYVVSDRDSAESELFGQAAERWIATRRTVKTIEKYTTVRTVHLTAIAGRKLSDVAQDRDGIEALTVNHSQGKAMLALIRSTCQAAVNAGRLSSHRLDGLKCNHVAGIRELIFATPEQLNQIEDAMGDSGLAVRIMRTCGLRPAEVLALRDTDLMLNGMLHVSRQIQNGKVIPLKRRQDFKGRDIPVAPTLRAMIRAHVKAHGPGNLFKIRYSAFNAWFKRARDAADPFHYANGSVAPTRLFVPYQLRHGFASALLPAGVALTDVSRWMGHADTRETSRVYADLMPGQADRARDLLEADMTGTTEVAASDAL